MSLASVAAPLLACAGLHCVSLGLARARLTPPQLECLLGSCERGEAGEAAQAGQSWLTCSQGCSCLLVSYEELWFQFN